MLAGYTAIICSPPFLYLEEEPGRLDNYALASRLSFFLWNSPPDEALLARAHSGELAQPGVLRSEVERLLNDPKSRRFVEAFLDYWLDLRKFDATTPSNTLYPDYYLDEGLTEAALDESRMFFTELLEQESAGAQRHRLGLHVSQRAARRALRHSRRGRRQHAAGFPPR